MANPGPVGEPPGEPRRARREAAHRREHVLLDMHEVVLEEPAEPLDRRRCELGGIEHVLMEQGVRRVDRGELELLLRAEVGEQPALAHPDGIGEPAEGLDIDDGEAPVAGIGDVAELVLVAGDANRRDGRIARRRRPRSPAATAVVSSNPSRSASSVTAQWSGTVPVDAEGRHLYPAVIWMDSRGAPQVEDLIMPVPTASGGGYGYGSILTAR